MLCAWRADESDDGRCTQALLDPIFSYWNDGDSFGADLRRQTRDSDADTVVQSALLNKSNKPSMRNSYSMMLNVSSPQMTLVKLSLSTVFSQTSHELLMTLVQSFLSTDEAVMKAITQFDGDTHTQVTDLRTAHQATDIRLLTIRVLLEAVAA